jgi:hypothetical protein
LKSNTRKGKKKDNNRETFFKGGAWVADKLVKKMKGMFTAIIGVLEEAVD